MDLKYPVEVLWLNSDEFVIMFYFLTGVSFLSDVYNLKSKAKKVFQKCLEILNKQLEDLKNSSKSALCLMSGSEV